MSEQVKAWIEEVIEGIVASHTDAEYAEEWDLNALCKDMEALYGSEITPEELREEVDIDSREALIAEFADDALDAYEDKQQEFGQSRETGQPLMREVERYLILQIVDRRWREHLENMEYLRDGIHLRAMAQKDPLVEYRHEGHLMFEELGRGIREEVVFNLFHAHLAPEAAAALQAEPVAADGNVSYEHESVAGAQAIAAAGATAGAGTTAASMTPVGRGGAAVATRQRVATEHDKIGRNDPCWCGSGKKFKKCHGA
jgi:preprotein translocase subunit SecA